MCTIWTYLNHLFILQDVALLSDPFESNMIFGSFWTALLGPVTETGIDKEIAPKMAWRHFHVLLVYAWIYLVYGEIHEFFWCELTPSKCAYLVWLPATELPTTWECMITSPFPIVERKLNQLSQNGCQSNPIQSIMSICNECRLMVFFFMSESNHDIYQ